MLLAKCQLGFEKKLSGIVECTTRDNGAGILVVESDEHKLGHDVHRGRIWRFGSKAEIYTPYTDQMRKIGGVVLDSSGTLYATDNDHHRILKITQKDSEIVVSTIAGQKFGDQDGFFSQACLQFPTSLVSDGEGNLYIMDYVDNPYGFVKIKKVYLQREAIITIAHFRCEFNSPMVYERSSNSLFVLCEPHIHKFDLNQIQEPLPIPTLKHEKPVLLKPTVDYLIFHRCLTSDNKGMLYSIDLQNNDISKINAHTLQIEERILESYHQNSGVMAIIEALRQTRQICLDEEGFLYLVQHWNTIYKISSTVLVDFNLIHVGGLPWKVAKLLYAGQRKHSPVECVLARLPREILDVIIQSCTDK